MATATATQLAPSSTEDAFLKSLHEKHAAPLWTVLSQLVPPFPNPKAVPTVWRYSGLRPSLMEAGKIVGAEEAERRVLMLVNSNMRMFTLPLSLCVRTYISQWH